MWKLALKVEDLDLNPTIDAPCLYLLGEDTDLTLASASLPVKCWSGTRWSLKFLPSQVTGDNSRGKAEQGFVLAAPLEQSRQIL